MSTNPYKDDEFMAWFMEHAYDPNFQPPPREHGKIPGDKWFLNHTHTPEARKRISEKQKVNMLGKQNALGHKKSDKAKEASKRYGTDNGRATRVLVDGITYDTVRDAVDKSPYSSWQLRDKKRFPRVL